MKQPLCDLGVHRWIYLNNDKSRCCLDCKQRQLKIMIPAYRYKNVN